MPRKKLTAVSLFTGAGGLDLGFEAAGFEHLACIEQDDDARKTLVLNRPAWNLWCAGNVHEAPPIDVLNSVGLQQGDLDVLIGGPPCQPFSKSAYWSKGDTKRLLDERADTLRAFLEYVEEMLPRALVIENVRGIAFEGKDEAVSFIHRWLRRINRHHSVSYKLHAVPVRAVEYGVPQLRDRTLLVAFRDGCAFNPPPITHSESAAGGRRGLCKFRTAWDAIGDIRLSPKERDSLALKGKWADLLPTIPEGENYLWHTERGGGKALFGWRTRYWSFLLKLSREHPAWTIQASPGPATGPFHWDNRNLSVREMCRIQTFPDSYEIVGGYASARRQLGNAVPPALAEAVANQIRTALLGRVSVNQKNFAAPYRRRGGQGCSVARLPKKFKYLIGEYADHPGPGKGPGALSHKEKFQPEITSTSTPLEGGGKNRDIDPILYNRHKFATTKIA